MCKTACKNNRCTGLKLGDTCVNVGDCLGYAYCNQTTLKCESLPVVSCTTDYGCGIDSACDGGKCVPYFSLANGSNTAVYETDGTSWTCASGYAAAGKTSGVKTCAEPPKTKGTYNIGINKQPIACSVSDGDLCYSTIDGVTKPCECGTNGNGYCPAFAGDVFWQDAITNWKKLHSNAKLNYGWCNTKSRFALGCY
jgi:hypothetical protein